MTPDGWIKKSDTAPNRLYRPNDSGPVVVIISGAHCTAKADCRLQSWLEDLRGEMSWSGLKPEFSASVEA